MKSIFNPTRIDFVRRYVEKHMSSTSHEVTMELCDETQKLWDENVALRERLFQIEQEQDSDKRWETILAAKLDRAIAENKNKDYLEIANSINNDIFIITIQRKFGQSPEQLRQSSDVRRIKAAKKIVNLSKDNRLMQLKLHQLGEELRILKAIKNGDWEDVKTRKDVETAIDIVNNFIRQHNQYAYKKHLGSLTNSMRESFHESWYRVADGTHQINLLKKEIELLKFEFHRKNVEKSKFGKYRKRDKRKCRGYIR